jgi:hypothetical protein
VVCLVDNYGGSGNAVLLHPNIFLNSRFKRRRKFTDIRRRGMRIFNVICFSFGEFVRFGCHSKIEPFFVHSADNMGSSRPAFPSKL